MQSQDRCQAASQQQRAVSALSTLLGSQQPTDGQTVPSTCSHMHTASNHNSQLLDHLCCLKQHKAGSRSLLRDMMESTVLHSVETKQDACCPSSTRAGKDKLPGQRLDGSCLQQLTALALGGRHRNALAGLQERNRRRKAAINRFVRSLSMVGDSQHGSMLQLSACS